MANNVLSNGRIHHTTVPQNLNTDRGKKVPDIPAIEARNWLLYKHYTRHEYKICKILVEEELTRSNGYNEYAFYLKGLILRLEGKVQDSMDCFQTCYYLNTKNVDNIKQIAKSLFLLGSHRRSLEAYLEAEKVSAGAADWEVFYRLGECYIKLNQLPEGKRCLKRAIGLTADERPYLSLAKTYIAENLVPEAVQVYESALSVCSENVDVAVELGLLYLKLGDTRKAFQQFGLALAQRPSNGAALLPMGSVMQTNKEYDVALSKYRIAAGENPESVALWNNIGMCFYGKRKFVAAISCLKRAHYLNPLVPSSAFNLGVVLLSTGQPASAAVYLCSAASNSVFTLDSKQAGQTYMLLGVALKQLEDFEGAEKAMAKAYSLVPRDPLVLINFAVVMEAGGKRQRASDLLVELQNILTTVGASSEHNSEILETAQKLSLKLKQTEEEPAAVASDARTFSDDEV